MNVNFNLTQPTSANNPAANLMKKGSNYSKRGFQKQSRKEDAKSVFEVPMEESKYLKFLMKNKYPIFENEEQNERRLQALDFLSDLVDKWQIDLAVNIKKIGEAESRHAQILQFGSYRLGVHFPDTDMDLICVFPSYILQDDFFNIFKNVIEKADGIREIIDVVDAKVPILKIKYKDLQIDLLYAALDVKYFGPSQKPIEKLIKDENLFDTLNYVSQNSLNGLKATQNLLKSVPNMQNFRNTLRLVRFWAMKRGIYSNIFGYLGGVSYSIMVAKICQDNPDLDLADLLYKFFEVYSEWKWFDPVFIKIGRKRDTKLNLNNLKMLDEYSSDHMPILTPNTTPKNSAYRVCLFTYYTICKELTRAKHICKQLPPETKKKYCSSPNDSSRNHRISMMEENKENESLSSFSPNTGDKSKVKVKWSLLFKRFRFFSAYEHFVKIDVLSTDLESHAKWLGYVESQLRRLIQLFQDLEQISDLRIYPRAFSREETKDVINNQFKCCDSFFIGFKLSETNPAVQVNIREQVVNFCKFLDIGRLKKLLNNVRILYYRKVDLDKDLVARF